jgi:hypothetical protein
MHGHAIGVTLGCGLDFGGHDRSAIGWSKLVEYFPFDAALVDQNDGLAFPLKPSSVL